MSAVAGRLDCGLDLERMVDRLRDGHGGATVLLGEPGIGKTTLLTAMAGYAKSLGVGVKRLRRLPRVTAAWEPSDGALLVLDDLHRLPGSCAPALEALIERTASRPILLAAAHRPRQLPVDVAAVLFRAGSAGALHSHPLGPLTLADARRILGDHPDLASIHHAGQGNPAYMRMLAAASPDTCEAAGAFSAELAQLSEAELRVARVAAALGDPFSPDLLTAVVKSAPARTLAALDSLVARDLLRPREPAPLLAFRHPVVASVVYHGIPVSQRRELHRRIEAELGRRAGPVAQRAFHIARAADPSDPAHAGTLLAAAQQATEGNPQESITWLTVALSLMKETDERWCEAQLLLARARLLAGQCRESREALHTLLARQPDADPAVMSAALVLSSEVERSLGNYREADAFAHAAGDVGAAATTPADGAGAALTARLHHELAEHAIEALNFDMGVRHAITAARHAHRENDRALEVKALSLAALGQFAQGPPADPEPAIVQAARCADAMSDAILLRDLSCLYELAHAERQLERFADAERHALRGLALARHSGQSHVLPALLKTLGNLQLQLGRLPSALETLDSAARHARVSDRRPSQALVAAIRATTLVWLRPGEDTAEAVAAADEALSACGALDTGFTVVVRAMVADTLIQAGQAERGIRLLLQAAGGWELPRLSGSRRPRYWDALVEAHARDGGDPVAVQRYARMAEVQSGQWPTRTSLGFAGRALARAHGVRGNPDRAAEAGDAACRHFDTGQARLEAGRCLVVVANACLDNGSREGVAARLDRAAEIAAICGSLRLAGQVSAARQRLGTVNGTKTLGLSQLTAREFEVARLVSTGMTNGQIAAGLRLSVRTIESHLARVYQKLGVPNRTSLTRILAQRSG